jgi:hypothetical protein
MWVFLNIISLSYFMVGFESGDLPLYMHRIFTTTTKMQTNQKLDQLQSIELNFIEKDLDFLKWISDFYHKPVNEYLEEIVLEELNRLKRLLIDVI